MATTNGSFAQQEQYKSSEQYTPTAGHAASESANTATNGNSNQEPSKDEVGWYFVEQYYTTLSRSPEKLHVSSHAICARNSLETDTKTAFLR